MRVRTRRARPLLRRGDTVGVLATGFAVKAASLRAGVRSLERMGFRVRLGQAVLEQDGYLAGPDEARLADLVKTIDDPEVRAIWFARGGYGTARLLDRIPWRRLDRRPLTLIGYSDLTALFAPVVDRTEARCLYGPVVTELGTPGAWDPRSLREALAGRPVVLRIRSGNVVVPGRASGPLAGGNLSVLTHSLGTRFAPRLAGRVLFLEDVGEPVYRIDRMLTQWRQSGALGRAAGVLIGELASPPRRRFPPDRELDRVLHDRLGDLGVPVVRGLPVGHRPGKVTLPLGGRVEIDTRAGRVRFQP